LSFQPIRNRTLNKQQSTLRIIAGKWRGRKITFPSIDTTRPTTDRLRETAFNWLMPYIQGAKCLDAFAGSGILGFEALSRGAKHITFIDQLRSNIASIEHNAQQLNSRAAIDTHCANFFSLDLNTPFDIIFLDPPYHQDLITSAMANIKKRQWLHKNTIVYIEAEKEMLSRLPSVIEILKQKTTKRILISLGKLLDTPHG
jgi:16S rRNA (guanine966-N2)-methyltransferase